jgi:hypothetical protein
MMTVATPAPAPPAPAWKAWVPNLLTAVRLPLGLYYPRVVHRRGAAFAVIAAAGLTDWKPAPNARRASSARHRYRP